MAVVQATRVTLVREDLPANKKWTIQVANCFNCTNCRKIMDTVLQGSHLEKKNLLLFGKSPKGGGGACPNPNVSRNFFALFMFGQFSERGGGVALFQTF